MGLDYRHVVGEKGEVAQLVKNEVVFYMRENHPEIADLVKEITVRMPWKRIFETGIKLK